MTDQQIELGINHDSLKVLFRHFKQTKDNSILGEIYMQTYKYLFSYIHPRVSSVSIAVTLVQQVYKVFSTQELSEEKEQDVISYLERLADGCLVLHSRDEQITEENRVYA